MPDGLDQLAATLGAPPPAEFAALSAEELARLDGLVVTALAARKAALDEALGEGLHMVPRLARPAVAKVLGL